MSFSQIDADSDLLPSNISLGPENSDLGDNAAEALAYTCHWLGLALVAADAPGSSPALCLRVVRLLVEATPWLNGANDFGVGVATNGDDNFEGRLRRFSQVND